MISVIFFVPFQKGHVYDCRISEISPDVPVSVKEACRKLNAKIYNK
jgi:hypothetical protein